MTRRLKINLNLLSYLNFSLAHLILIFAAASVFLRNISLGQILKELVSCYSC